MWIKTIIKDSNDFKEECTESGKKIYNFYFNDIKENKFKLISEEIFFDLNIDMTFKKDMDKNKIVLIGGYNNQFWFFKIISKNKKNPFVFSIKKPLLQEINQINLSIIDWDNVLTKFVPQKIVLEYAICRES